MRPNFLVAAIIGMAIACPAIAEEPQRQLTVTGSGEVEAAPDLATVTAGVENQAASAGAALAENSGTMAAVFAALEAAGIAPGDRQTSELNLSPVYAAPGDDPQAPQRVVAYQASNMMTVRVRDVGGLGAVIDALAGAGANRLYGVGFEVSDPRTKLDAAREKAVADARAKAELFAKAAGVTLGAVLSLRENGGGGTPAPFRAKAELASAPPVAEGAVTLTADVELVYAIN